MPESLRLAKSLNIHKGVCLIIMAKDYYKILGVDKSAGEEDVKRAFRKLAHQYHPDKAGGNEVKFKELNEAYQVLSDKTKRAQYDRFGTAEPFGGFGGQSPFGGFDMGGFQGFGGGEDLGDIFETFFEGMGVRPKRRTYNQGSDIETLQEITLEDAYNGAQKHLRIHTHLTCATCKGQGGDPSAGTKTCEACNGRGEVRVERRTFFGNFARVEKCEKCHGVGKTPNKVCPTCKGHGRISGEREIVVDIVKGIQDNQVIQIRHAGEAGEHGASAGDLYIRVRVKQHPLFERRGDDLVIKKEMSVFDLLLGKPLVIPTIKGKNIEVTIPPHFNLKEYVRVSGEGMPRFGSFSHGDLLVDLTMKTPKKLSSKAKKLLEDLEAEE